MILASRVSRGSPLTTVTVVCFLALVFSSGGKKFLLRLVISSPFGGKKFLIESLIQFAFSRGELGLSAK